MDDLDSLLEDLGRGKSSSNAGKKQRPPSSRVDLNELEDLMEDLAAPTARAAPPPEPVKVATPTPAPAPLVQATAVAQPSTSVSANSVEDLDALMESLNSSGSRASRRQSKIVSVNTSAAAALSPAATPAPAPAPVMEPPRPTGPAPVMSSGSAFIQPRTPAAAPVAAPYVPPVNTYTPPAAAAPAPAPAPAPASGGMGRADDLDALLQNLTTQMNNVSAENPAARGTCAQCRMAILGEVVQAIGKTYHPEHFICGNCKDPLGTRTFFEHSGSPFCEKCYQAMFCPKCGHCDGPIFDRCITALGKKWHADHFICTQCLKPFGTNPFFERDGRPYCEDDFFNLFAPKCGSCKLPVKGDCINALGQQWHPEHFVCTYCGKAFGNGMFFENGGKPFCETHYHQQSGSLCAGCGKPVTGRCVNALDKDWHPAHFVCAFCMNPLAGGSFSEHNNKAYCKECHGKLFGA